MSDLDDLYQEVVLDHNRRPRNSGRLASANREADGYNPLCGDRVTVYLEVQDNVITDISFEGTGCAISTASASLMTEGLKGKTLDDARALFDGFHGLVTRGPDDGSDPVDLGKLVVFSGVGRFPARVKCATLAWHTVKAAMDNATKPVTTE